MEKLKIYQPRINPHVFSANAHPENDINDRNDIKIWNGENKL